LSEREEAEGRIYGMLSSPSEDQTEERLDQ
jgi:hypothetical protein